MLGEVLYNARELELQVHVQVSSGSVADAVVAVVLHGVDVVVVGRRMGQARPPHRRRHHRGRGSSGPGLAGPACQQMGGGGGYLSIATPGTISQSPLS